MSHFNLRGIFCFVSFLICLCFAQETHNLEIIWTIPGNPVLYAFGYNMAGGYIDNDGLSDIVVSADTFDENGGTTPYYGRAYLYFGTGIGDTIPDVVFKSPFAKGTTPTRVHSADINGDNFEDIIMAEDQVDVGYGGVTIFWGGIPVDTIPDVILRGRSVGAEFFGCAVSSGDVNGDSLGDLIVGAYGSGNHRGRVYIYFGGPNFDTIPDVILNGGHDGQLEHFGITVGGGGDVNSDGKEDVIIGADLYGPGERGRIYIYFGGNPMDTIYDVAMIGEVPNQSLGWTPTVNLLNTEFEYDMAVFGSAFWPYGFPQVGSGKVYVLFGGNPMDSVPDIWMIGRTDTTGLGRRIASAGDINGDFSDDIISGAPTDYNSKGTVYIWLGGTLLDTIPDAWIRGDEQIGGIGWMVASAGDVNGDVKDEIMVSNYPVAVSPKKVWVCKYTGPGIEEESLTQNARCLTLEINPNPAKSVVRVRGSFSERNIKIFDISGKMIKEIYRSAPNDGVGETRISLKGINPGIYFLRVSKETKKFLVVR